MPKSLIGMLTAVPRGWRTQLDPFDNPRIFDDGSLPSFKEMGAIGMFAFGAGVIYKPEAYKFARNLLRVQP